MLAITLYLASALPTGRAAAQEVNQWSGWTTLAGSSGKQDCGVDYRTKRVDRNPNGQGNYQFWYEARNRCSSTVTISILNTGQGAVTGSLVVPAGSTQRDWTFSNKTPSAQLKAAVLPKTVARRPSEASTAPRQSARELAEYCASRDDTQCTNVKKELALSSKCVEARANPQILSACEAERRQKLIGLQDYLDQMAVIRSRNDARVCAQTPQYCTNGHFDPAKVRFRIRGPKAVLGGPRA